jgi:hypothetical protein
MEPATPFVSNDFQPSAVPHTAPPVGFQGPTTFRQSVLPVTNVAVAPHGFAPTTTSGNGTADQAPDFYTIRVDANRLRGAEFNQSRLVFYLNEADPTKKTLGKTCIVTLDTLLNTFCYDVQGNRVALDDPTHPPLPARLFNMRPHKPEELEVMMTDVALMQMSTVPNFDFEAHVPNFDLQAQVADEMRALATVKLPQVCTLKMPRVSQDHRREKKLAREHVSLLTSILEPLPGAALLRRAMEMFNLSGVTLVKSGAIIEPDQRNNNARAPITTIPSMIYFGTCMVANYWIGCTNLQPMTDLWLILHLAPAVYPDNEADKLTSMYLRNADAYKIINEFKAGDPTLQADRNRVAATVCTRRLCLTPYANANYTNPRLDPSFDRVFMPDGSPCALLHVGIVNGAYIPKSCQSHTAGSGQRSYNHHPVLCNATGDPIPWPRRANGAPLAGDGSDRLGIWLRHNQGPDNVFGGRFTLITP